MADSASTQIIERHLAACGLTYSDAGGYLRGVVDLGEGRTQLFLVDVDVDQMGPYRDFDILSPICKVAEHEAKLKALAYTLLEFSGKQKLGSLSIRHETLVYKADCPLEAPTEVFKTILTTVCRTADTLEKILTDGSDAF